MIQLKIGNYSRDDKSLLYDALQEARLAICGCTEWRLDECTDCPSKRVCDDIKLALDYLVKELTK